MLVELELVKVSRLLAEAKTADGKTVSIGYRKSANVLIDLQGKPVGHKFMADIEISTEGRLYNANTLDVEKAYNEVNMMRKRNTLIDKQIAMLEIA